MTKLYLIRHGQSLANQEGVFAGHYDVDLTDLGRAQAEKVADFFTKGFVPVDAIAASDLLRAYKTARPLSDRLGLPIEAREDLREIFAGAWENVSFSWIQEEYGEDYALWRMDPGYARCTEGESTEEVSRRVLAAVTEIAERYDGKTVVVATHATVIRALTTLWLRGDIHEMKEVDWVPNASVTEVNFENGTFTLGRIGVTEHLEGLVSVLPPNV